MHWTIGEAVKTTGRLAICPRMRAPLRLVVGRAGSAAISAARTGRQVALKDYPKDARRRAAGVWAFRARAEALASGRFVQLARDLEDVGAPQVVVDLAGRGAEEEDKHIGLCMDLVEALGGRIKRQASRLSAARFLGRQGKNRVAPDDWDLLHQRDGQRDGLGGDDASGGDRPHARDIRNPEG